MGAKLTICSLPRKVALVRIQQGDRQVFLSAPCLSRDQLLAARVFATAIGRSQPLVVITMLDVLAILHAAA